MPRDLPALSAPELFSLYRGILGELKCRNMIRTDNNPAGDYAEFLVMTALGGELAANSEKSWDVRGSDGEKLQVKCRVLVLQRHFVTLRCEDPWHGAATA